MEYFDKHWCQEIDMRRGLSSHKQISARMIDSDIRWLDNFILASARSGEYMMLYLRGSCCSRDRVFGYVDMPEELCMFLQENDRSALGAPPKPNKAYIHSRVNKGFYYTFGPYTGVDIGCALLFLLLYKQGKHKNCCLFTPNTNRKPMLAAHRYTYRYNYVVVK